MYVCTGCVELWCHYKSQSMFSFHLFLFDLAHVVTSWKAQSLNSDIWLRTYDIISRCPLSDFTQRGAVGGEPLKSMLQTMVYDLPWKMTAAQIGCWKRLILSTLVLKCGPVECGTETTPSLDTIKVPTCKHRLAASAQLSILKSNKNLRWEKMVPGGTAANSHYTAKPVAKCVCGVQSQ